MRRGLGPVLITLVLVGCGGDGEETGSDLLFRDSSHGAFDFGIEPGDPATIRVDYENSVDREGHVTSTHAGKVREVDLSESELDELEDALAELDLERLEERFGNQPGDRIRSEITYNGETVVIGDFAVPDAFDDADRELARSYHAVVAILSDVFVTPAQQRADARYKERLIRQCIQSGRPPELCSPDSSP